VKCAAFFYPFLLDLDGTTVVADASRAYRFVNSCAGKSIDDLSASIPLLIARAGQDEFPQLNETIDRFVTRALLRNLPVTLLNHAGGPHAFDLLQESEATRATIRQVLEFLGSYLAL
jgi:acetyl esterase/lipase